MKARTDDDAMEELHRLWIVALNKWLLVLQLTNYSGLVVEVVREAMRGASRWRSGMPSPHCDQDGQLVAEVAKVVGLTGVPDLATQRSCTTDLLGRRGNPCFVGRCSRL